MVVRLISEELQLAGDTVHRLDRPENAKYRPRAGRNLSVAGVLYQIGKETLKVGKINLVKKLTFNWHWARFCVGCSLIGNSLGNNLKPFLQKIPLQHTSSLKKNF